MRMSDLRICVPSQWRRSACPRFRRSVPGAACRPRRCGVAGAPVWRSAPVRCRWPATGCWTAGVPWRGWRPAPRTAAAPSSRWRRTRPAAPSARRWCCSPSDCSSSRKQQQQQQQTNTQTSGHGHQGTTFQLRASTLSNALCLFGWHTDSVELWLNNGNGAFFFSASGSSSTAFRRFFFDWSTYLSIPMTRFASSLKKNNSNAHTHTHTHTQKRVNNDVVIAVVKVASLEWKPDRCPLIEW